MKGDQGNPGPIGKMGESGLPGAMGLVGPKGIFKKNKYAFIFVLIKQLYFV